MYVLAREQVDRAVALQARGYHLLQWLEKALADGFIAPEAAHSYATMEQSALAWIERHYLNLPNAARPTREDLPAFSRLFSTYLTNTFDLEANPGQRLFSPNAHCFCPCCSWMVRVPHLKPKKIGVPDRKVAESMKRDFARRLALGLGLTIPDETLDKILQDPGFRESIGLSTYAYDLLRRLEGIAIGPATLVLWRTFAWTAKGSPKKDFVLSTDLILDAQKTLAVGLTDRAQF